MNDRIDIGEIEHYNVTVFSQDWTTNVKDRMR